MVCARSTWCVAAVVALGAALPGCGAFQAGVVGTFAPSLRRATSLPVSMRVERHLRTRLQASSLDREFHKKGTTWGTPPELRRVDPLDENTKNVIKFSVNALKGLITFLFQGEGREFARFYVLETVARVPYFSYLSILHLFESLGFHERAAWIKVHFAEADNELHHLLIMESLGGSDKFPDRLFAQHSAVFYFWICAGLYLVRPRAAYYVTQLIEEHAYQTYDTFLKENEDTLRARQAPLIAKQYYEGADMYMFDAFHTTGNEKRRPVIKSLYEVFENIRDDEAEHKATIKSLVDNGSVYANEQVTEHFFTASDTSEISEISDSAGTDSWELPASGSLGADGPASEPRARLGTDGPAAGLDGPASGKETGAAQDPVLDMRTEASSETGVAKAAAVTSSG